MSSQSSRALDTGIIHLPVSRTARVATAGEPGASVEELWIVVHGYGQLAPLFIRHFSPLADGTRWILAPEALSRFYHEMPDAERHLGVPPEQRRVGAAWLTREERDAEIEDSVQYLDAVFRMARLHVRPDVKLVVLGFSQGVSVASRWLAMSELEPMAHHLICWSGSVPQELVDADLTIRARHATLVVGDADPWVKQATVEEQRQRLSVLAVEPRVMTFSGGHRMDPPTLASLLERPAAM